MRLAFSFAAALLFTTGLSPAAVTLTEHPDRFVLSNGIVGAEIQKSNGNLLDLQHHGKSVMAEPAYLDWVSDRNHHIAGGRATVVTNPAEQGGKMAEVAVLQSYDGSNSPLDVELHYVLRDGESGLQVFAVFNHAAAYPAGGFGQARFVMRLKDDLFDFIQVDEARRRPMPPASTPTKALGPKESLQYTEGPFAGQITDKYHYFVEAGGHFLHGWTGTVSHEGCWILSPSTEDQNGGPTRQHNTAHFGRILLKILGCGHYGAGGLSIAQGAAWRKVYGPWMIYLNSGDTHEALWTDARKQVAALQAQWPYAWMTHSAYVKAEGRGTVKGMLHFADGQNPGVSAAGAWVGLAAPMPDWQQQSAGYQFWAKAGADGAFTLPQVQAGSYTLYAFGPGIFDEYRHDGVVVAPGQRLDLGTLEWQPVHRGRQVWQIGTPDRTAAEFRHGDDFRQWGLWKKYPEEFPHDVHFVVGTSHERTDWNYAQVNVERDGAWVGTTWHVAFDMPESPKGTATLRLAIAASHNAALRIELNGAAAGDTGKLGDDNAMIRAGIHGQFLVREVRFPAAMLKAGRNELTLTQRLGGSVQRNVMYDCLRLEIDDADAP